MWDVIKTLLSEVIALMKGSGHHIYLVFEANDSIRLERWVI